ncbi:MAG: Type 1 glutamine amidotransferase-like domain-containing protein [Bifidobacterium psychraerophilum]|uniref:Type 1 glutamine amidotransferase-like domain-containing protein n=1 Tax=Bifidobacterium psychraerophilum TaxID=218140 RepID=UPI0039EC0052
MMQNLFLSSSFEDVAQFFPEFIGEDIHGRTACLIPTASNKDKINFFVNSDRNALKDMGVTVSDLDIAEASTQEISSKLDEADYIFVSGGNTFYLLEEMRRSGAGRMIVEQINAGKPYIGASAGSVILSHDITYISPMDSSDVAPSLDGDFTALGVTDFSVLPHVGNIPFRKAANTILKSYGEQFDLRAISNNQVITVVNGRTQTLTAA